jgi:RNA polymerase sigma factor (TIGR02999 family)
MDVPGEKSEDRAAPGVTGLLRAWRAGDDGALAQLMPVVYDELHRIAHAYMARERGEHLLQSTALVSELYLRLVDARAVDWQDRAHFFALCARLMRRVLVDLARARWAQKGSGRVRHVDLDEADGVALAQSPALLAVDEALTRLGSLDERKARVVELRFFAGMTAEETAAALNVSAETVTRDWRFARAWLLRELSAEGEG